MTTVARPGVESGPAGSSPFHHGDHRGLLAEPEGPVAGPAEVDAIIVPAARHASYIREAVRVAGRIGAVLVVLCSRATEAAVVYDLARSEGVEVVAIDVTRLMGRSPGLIPVFGTARVLDEAKLARTSDTSLKRNLGLLLANLAGWRRVVFLDDDMVVPDAHDLCRAAGLVGSFHAVGLVNSGFRDNSVVCHAFHATGGDQGTFIGGGALAIGRAAMRSFFPDIYNEDWFFLLGDTGIAPVTMIGNVVQKRFDPFDRPERARSEELGDVLAEGVFWLLDHKRRVRDADLDFWVGGLDRRRKFIDEVINRVAISSRDAATVRQMMICLKAARGRSQLISPDLCVKYLRAWRADRTKWQRHIDAQLSSTEVAIASRRSKGPARRGRLGALLAALEGRDAMLHSYRNVDVSVAGHDRACGCKAAFAHLDLIHLGTDTALRRTREVYPKRDVGIDGPELAMHPGAGSPVTVGCFDAEYSGCRGT